MKLFGDFMTGFDQFEVSFFILSVMKICRNFFNAVRRKKTAHKARFSAVK